MKNNTEVITYEAIKERLNEILAAVESPEVNIEVLIPLLEEADALTKQCETMLRDSQAVLELRRSRG
jgi:exodeoxyribonuclease VII small subunit